MRVRHVLTVELVQFLILLFALQIKHLLADFTLQTQYMIQNRRFYGHPGGLAHVAVHLAGSTLAFLLVGGSAAVIVAILIAEAVIHYHIDWTKDRVVLRYALTPQNRSYWFATGVDQALHQLTYVIMVVAWIEYAF